ncbi:hemicentin-2-like [Astyanax mexicanus]|uniref:Hemicentin-2-like n=1 Tax=Astyanax mexicanus TaxID=7994 RepID=A0A8T2L6Z6_ASTMX|nr:hemicentin-2-like [Astyanax mexicanus]KAG9267019.1 hemicentin-2-like [Astyanax mexicanus]
MGEGLGLQLMSILFWAGVVTKTGGSIPRPQFTGPNMAYVKSTQVFECKLPEWTLPLTYELIKSPGEVLETVIDPLGGQPVTFYLRVNERSNGRYMCRVRLRGQTSTSNAVNFQVVIPVQGVHLVPDPDPPVIYEMSGFNLHCRVRKGTHLTYVWYHNQQELNLPSAFHQISENTLTVDSAGKRHAGYYTCMAINKMGNHSRYSSSMEVNVVVKEYLSAPRISFTLYYHGSGYHANISCRLVRGSPPVTFRLLLDGEAVAVQRTGSLEAWFSVPVSVGLDMGTAQCKAETDIQQLLSDPVDLEVVPVEGSAQVLVEFLQTADSVVAAALLQCVITRGTFPLFSWSLNQAILPEQGDSHALTPNGRILVITAFSAENSGYYSCRARDSFNSNSSWLQSEEVLVKMTDIRMTSIEVLAVVFCCFLLLVIVAGACCVFWIISQERFQDRSTGHEMDCLEQINNETLETRSAPQVEEMVEVFMEVEV